MTSKILLKTKYSVTIARNITTLYCNKTNVITFIGPLKKKSVVSDVKLVFLTSSNNLIITNCPVKINSKFKKSMQGTTLAHIKQALVEVNYKLYKKLNLVGVGYRTFLLDSTTNQLFFKLGFSHLVYFKIPNDFGTFSIKTTKLFIFGNVSYKEITKLASLVRGCKKPEPYKGKGILYYGEKVKLKKGKKI